MAHHHVLDERAGDSAEDGADLSALSPADAVEDDVVQGSRRLGLAGMTRPRLPRRRKSGEETLAMRTFSQTTFPISPPSTDSHEMPEMAGRRFSAGISGAGPPTSTFRTRTLRKPPWESVPNLSALQVL